jgi:hypothetical protein
MTTAAEDLGELHHRYVDLSQRFRAAWVFHQFLQSLAKLSGTEGAPLLAGPFQELYADLKECAQALSATDSGRLATQLTAIDRELAGLTATLSGDDTRWVPGDLRRFFRRYKNYDGKVLVQLVRFYLHAEPVAEWSADRKDKVDFLVTRLEEEERGGGVDRRDELLASLWHSAGSPEVPDERIDAVLRALTDIRDELAEVTSLEDLDEREALRTYREFKHSLEAVFFEPRVLSSLLATNLAFRDVVAQLYAREERRITEEYQRVLDLGREGEMSADLDGDLAHFHQEVERFERNLERDELRLDELSRLRRRVRALSPRLVVEEEAGSAEAATTTATAFSEVVAPGLPEDLADDDEDLLDAPYRRLIDVLGSVTLGSPAETIVHSADLFPFQLEAREVVAYRRLHGFEEGGAAGHEADAAERFLLEAAALRVLLADEVEAARSIEGTVAGVDRARLRRLAALGDAFRRRFEHFESEALLADRAGDARTLAFLRVRLTQPWCDLWLFAHDGVRRADAEGPRPRPTRS